MKIMATSEETGKKVDTYKIPCSICNGKEQHEIIVVSRKSGIKLKCLKCGKEIHRNIKYLEGKKNVE